MALWGKTDADNSRPKYLTAAELAKCVFVDATEAQLEANKSRGITGAGWWLVESYTDSNGVTRNKAECLVAMSVSAADAGDRADDATVADAAYVITIGTQPADQDTSSGAATFTVAATVTSGGGTLSYQWQKKPAATGSRWANVSGATSDSLALTGQTADNSGDQYRVRINSAGGAAEVISDAATLTFVD